MALCAGLAGCLASMPPPIEPVLNHFWRPISFEPNQAWQGPTHKVYTYVLMGNINAQGQDELSRRALQRLEKLLPLLMRWGPAPGGPQGSTDTWLLSRANAYCIPVKKEFKDNDRVTVGQFDVDLSRRYIKQLILATQNLPHIGERLNGPGPFLVALRTPFKDVPRTSAGAFSPTAPSAAVLLMDLSDVQPATMAEFENAYRSAIRDGVSQSNEIRPLLPYIANALKKADNNVPLVLEAFAKMKESISSANPSTQK